MKPKESPAANSGPGSGGSRQSFGDLGLRLSVSLDGKQLIVKIPITRVFEVVAPETADSLAGSISCNFTPRQREVFDHLCEGKCVKEIAEELHVSTSAIKHHIHDVLGKGRSEQYARNFAELWESSSFA